MDKEEKILADVKKEAWVVEVNAYTYTVITIEKLEGILNSLSDGGATIQISCWSCRKNKGAIDTLTARQLISCKYRFGAWSDKPCKEWLPSKRDIEIHIARSITKPLPAPPEDTNG